MAQSAFTHAINKGKAGGEKRRRNKLQGHLTHNAEARSQTTLRMAQSELGHAHALRSTRTYTKRNGAKKCWEAAFNSDK
jgi:hypothetical protein